ncbi:MAG TPA: YncE family protein [Thermoanaerobaculia bacterium]|nr:YncE family protein [Thermoanaerobaculia bacterium]
MSALSLGADNLPSQKVETAGVAVEFLTARPMAGEDVQLRFSIRAEDGSRVTGIRPAAWIDSRDPKAPGTACKDKIQSFLGGSLRARPNVDLNSYYIVTLNAEPSLAVIDPLVGFGGSKLLTAITLQSPGIDWVLSRDQKRLFVSMPLVNRVAVVDTESWEVVRNIDTAFKPGRLALHGDDRLWVAAETSLTVIDTKALTVVATVPVGRAPHQIAFTPDGERAFVTNGGDGNVSILNAVKPAKLADVATGASPAGIAASSLSATMYVIDANGAIAVIDANAQEISKRIDAKPGLSSIQFAPGGRWGFVTNSKENVVNIIDAATATIITTATDVGRNPDQVAFTDDFAYVRASGSDQVKMIRLAALGKDVEANLATFPAGQIPPAAAGAESFASAIVPAPEPKAVLIANPADRLVYYYMEGMAAPMGNFSAVRRSPKAALVIDRSLRESEPGVFSIRTKVPAAGQYDVAFFLNAPRVVHCFDLTVRPDPDAPKIAGRGVKVEPLLEKKAIHAGEELEVKFRLTDPATKELLRNVRDLRALAFLAPGMWQKRVAVEPAEDGLYRVKLTVPEPGVYYVFVESESLRLKVNAARPLIFEATGE